MDLFTSYIQASISNQSMTGFSLQNWISQHPSGEKFLNRILPDLNNNLENNEIYLFAHLLSSSSGIMNILNPPLKTLNDLYVELSRNDIFDQIGLEELNQWLRNRKEINSEEANSKVFRAITLDGELLVVAIDQFDFEDLYSIDRQSIKIKLIGKENDYQKYKEKGF